MVLFVSYGHRYLYLTSEDYHSCRLSLVTILKTLYHLNFLLSLGLVAVASFKSDGFALQEKTWDQVLAPLYFFMTEMLLVSIVSFVVLVNSMIQLCFTSNSSRVGRHFNKSNSEESKDQNANSNPSAVVRVSVWFLYVALCGLLSLFLLLKNSGSLPQ